jgi:hypothetical protein
VGKPLRSGIRSALAAIGALWLAGAAAADEWVSPFEWFPLTQTQWQKHTLGSGRVLSLETEADALMWRVDFMSQSGSVFREKSGAIQSHAPDGCDEIHVYREVLGETRDKERFRRVERGAKIVDPPTRAELEDLAGRWRAFVASGPLRPPRSSSHDPVSCEAIRRLCTDTDERTGMGRRFGVAPPGYSMNAPPPLRVPCDQADLAIEKSCIKGIQAEEASHLAAVARYEQSMRCVGLAVATRAADAQSIDLEVVSVADGEQWGRAEVGLDERVDPSAWAYAPLTVLADVPVMGLVVVSNGPLYLVATIYALTHY